MNFVTSVVFLLVVGLSLSANADHVDEVDKLLQSDARPDGVVFEIVSRDEAFLDWALPQAQAQAQRLRTKFAGLDIAIVTHGREQFALVSEKKEQKRQIHSLVQQLAVEQDITVHVCGTLAERRNVMANEFPDYVDVAAAGPAQINDYIKLGFVRIKIRPH